MKAESRYPVKDLMKFYTYDPETGDIVWKSRCAGMTFGDKTVSVRGARQSNGKCAGRSALYAHNAGYSAVALMGVAFLAHRVAWALHYGEWPKGQIDHINGDRRDNRITNLRVVDQTGNSRNAARPRTNKTGVIGVFWEERANRWKAYITADKKRVDLGSHNSFEAAVAARKAAESTFGFHQNHGRSPRRGSNGN